MNFLGKEIITKRTPIQLFLKAIINAIVITIIIYLLVGPFNKVCADVLVGIEKETISPILFSLIILPIIMIINILITLGSIIVKSSK